MLVSIIDDGPGIVDVRLFSKGKTVVSVPHLLPLFIQSIFFQSFPDLILCEAEEILVFFGGRSYHF